MLQGQPEPGSTDFLVFHGRAPVSGEFEGGGVVGELSAVNQRQAGVPVTYQDSALNVSLTAPPTGFSFARKRRRKKAMSAL